MFKFLIPLLGIFLLACNIDDKSQSFSPDVSNEEIKLENELFLTHNAVYQIHQILNIGLNNNTNLNEIFECASIDTLHLTNDSILYTLNFGFGTCNNTLEDKFIGDITIKQLGNLWNGNLFYAEISSNNLQINFNPITFNDTLSLFEITSNQKTIQIKGKQNITLNNTIVSRNIDRRFIYNIENSILNFKDLNFTIEGNSSLTDGENFNFINIITKPLQFNNECDYILIGELEILPERKVKRIINYGTEPVCDNIVEIKVGSLNKIFNLSE